MYYIHPLISHIKPEELIKTGALQSIQSLSSLFQKAVTTNWKCSLHLTYYLTIIFEHLLRVRTSLLAQRVEKSVCSARDLGLDPWVSQLPWGREQLAPPACLQNPMDRGAWWPQSMGSLKGQALFRALRAKQQVKVKSSACLLSSPVREMNKQQVH